MMIHAIVANEKRKSAVRVNFGRQPCRINMLKYASLAAIFAVLLSIGACEQKSNAEKETKVEPANVEIFHVAPQTIVNSYTASAILEGKEEALVTASISGEIKKFYVDKGAHVKKGDRLALIDPADYP
jgi:multidrug efflux pump subunit AcrA (membrane-fusion protein)